eukprot:10793369-Karenia_brevis.AAC.1
MKGGVFNRSRGEDRTEGGGHWQSLNHSLIFCLAHVSPAVFRQESVEHTFKIMHHNVISGQHGAAAWAAHRAIGSWQLELSATMSKLMDPEQMQRLKICTTSCPHVPDPADVWVLEQRSVARLFATFIIELGAQRCWSMSVNSMTMPD